jgi:hypothetical protein
VRWAASAEFTHVFEQVNAILKEDKTAIEQDLEMVKLTLDAYEAEVSTTDEPAGDTKAHAALARIEAEIYRLRVALRAADQALEDTT